MKSNIFSILLFSILFVVILIISAHFNLLKNINWGKLTMTYETSVTVVGQAESQQKNQIASFTAGVNSVSDNKETAIGEVNQKINAIITAVKNFGVNEADIKTSNINIYQREETYYEENRQKTRPGQWTVSNNIEIVLRNVDSAEQLAGLLSQSGATNVYGPNFRLEDTKDAETELLSLAVDNARQKAEKIAIGNNQKLGNIISVIEAGAVQPVYSTNQMGAGGGGGAIQPGSDTISKSVSVTFELK